MINCPFLAELTEARLYRGASTLQGKTVDDIAKITFVMILMLEILRYEDPDYAKKYVRDTMAYENFDVMRTGGTDLHNLIAVLNDQPRYDKIVANPNISVPVLQLKRYLNAMASGNKDKGQDRAFLMKLEQYFKISNTALKSARRSVGDWNDNSESEKSTIRHDIRNYLQNLGQYSDLFIHFKESSHRRDI